MEFNHSQLEWVITQIILAGIDRVASCAEVAPEHDHVYVDGVRETTGQALASIYTQMTGEEVGVGGIFDFIEGGMRATFESPFIAEMAQNSPKAVARWVKRIVTLIERGTAKPQ